jgi:transcriptional regulator with XRE-family HTH domain
MRSPIRSREIIAEEIRALMARRQVSQTELAQAIGVAPATLSERVRGLKPFDMDQLERIAEHLDTSIESIIIGARGAVA